MISTKLASISLAAALFFVLPAVQAQAQSIRTFVSTAGSDSNPCSITQPCRHFQAAVNATAVGGEVDALDPGAYGSFTISHAITIEGQGWSYVAPPSGGAAITISAGSSDKITIHGVSLNGVGTTNASGIQFNAGGSLDVQDSLIQNFTNSGILFTPTSSGMRDLFVSNTRASGNGGNGIQIFPSGSGGTMSVLDHVKMQNNGGHGLVVENILNNFIRVTVSDSVSAGNSHGIFADATSSAPITVVVRNSTISNNTNDGLSASDLAEIVVTRSTITNNGTGWSGSVTSYLDNNIDRNDTGNGEPPNPLTYQ